MCGIFGAVIEGGLDEHSMRTLVRHSQQRGRDSSGIVSWNGDAYEVFRADYPVVRLLNRVNTSGRNVVAGHSRLVTNGTADNQPVIHNGVIVIHNGIIVNHEELWGRLSAKRELEIDTEVIAAIAAEHIAAGGSAETIANSVLENVIGVAACVLVLPKLGKLLLFSNNGSLYLGRKAGGHVFASERHGLTLIGAEAIEQVREPVLLDIPTHDGELPVKDWKDRGIDLVPALGLVSSEERMLVYPTHELRRCSRCILPETMPFIRFDQEGVCNYCLNYKPRNQPRPKEELFELVEPYRRTRGEDAIVPFSGGRDSCYALHLIVNELGMKPVTYTYDWGMVTDLGRRNISRMSAMLGVENIIVAADITKKRANIRKNLVAWLRNPDPGMLSILTAGDKHFFRYVETIKQQTGISLNLWGINPLEVTHFKTGFLGVKPDFEEEKVYSSGLRKQLRYHTLRFKAMLKSPGYFNTSLWDTLSGEYYRSGSQKTDYFHIFDYWRWDEQQIESTLDDLYGWEHAPDTRTTWRIGDGTAAFYNYAYYTLCGFTEHDTFRSNQVREGDLTREEALDLVIEENAPRYPNLKWYLDAVGVDFAPAIKRINEAKRRFVEVPALET